MNRRLSEKLQWARRDPRGQAKIVVKRIRERILTSIPNGMVITQFVGVYLHHIPKVSCFPAKTRFSISMLKVNPLCIHFLSKVRSGTSQRFTRLLVKLLQDLVGRDKIRRRLTLAHTVVVSLAAEARGTADLTIRVTVAGEGGIRMGTIMEGEEVSKEAMVEVRVDRKDMEAKVGRVVEVMEISITTTTTITTTTIKIMATTKISGLTLEGLKVNNRHLSCRICCQGELWTLKPRARWGKR
mmetsp:Transcript_17173/g.56907  ORF Transcript_17173/g.56907 Transcript_17173/m.56907 type:complete len:241 (-) Transcript_17173:4558-5280(-)